MAELKDSQTRLLAAMEKLRKPCCDVDLAAALGIRTSSVRRTLCELRDPNQPRRLYIAKRKSPTGKRGVRPKAYFALGDRADVEANKAATKRRLRHEREVARAAEHGETVGSMREKIRAGEKFDRVARLEARAEAEEWVRQNIAALMQFRGNPWGLVFAQAAIAASSYGGTQ